VDSAAASSYFQLGPPGALRSLGPLRVNSGGLASPAERPVYPQEPRESGRSQTSQPGHTDVARFTQAPAERRLESRPITLAQGVQESDDRHRRLLRARRHRPRSAAAQNTEKFAPPHAAPKSQSCASYECPPRASASRGPGIVLLLSRT
jgi:hypothetical protein